MNQYDGEKGRKGGVDLGGYLYTAVNLCETEGRRREGKRQEDGMRVLFFWVLQCLSIKVGVRGRGMERSLFQYSAPAVFRRSCGNRRAGWGVVSVRF